MYSLHCIGLTGLVVNYEPVFGSSAYVAIILDQKHFLSVRKA